MSSQKNMDTLLYKIYVDLITIPENGSYEDLKSIIQNIIDFFEIKLQLETSIVETKIHIKLIPKETDAISKLRKILSYEFGNPKFGKSKVNLIKTIWYIKTDISFVEEFVSSIFNDVEIDEMGLN